MHVSERELEGLKLHANLKIIKPKQLVNGDVAQMVERSLCMREARGSIPRISSLTTFFSLCSL